MRDKTYESWCRLAGYASKRAYTCEGIGATGCERETVGQFYNDAHAQANGWNVDGRPICELCMSEWNDDMSVSLDMLDEMTWGEPVVTNSLCLGGVEWDAEPKYLAEIAGELASELGVTLGATVI
jgi:hypothetical protein